MYLKFAGLVPQEIYLSPALKDSRGHNQQPRQFWARGGKKDDNHAGKKLIHEFG